MKLLKYGTADVYYLDVSLNDKCPVCKSDLRTIRFYGGKLIGKQVSTSQGLMYDKTNTTLTYGDFQQVIGGYCSNCAERIFNDVDAKKKEVKKHTISSFG